MSSYQKSLLINYISQFGLDSRIGKILLAIKGTGMRIGEHVSKFPGHSPVIMDYRNYRNGDPLKDIDWKLSARTENLFVKIREGYRQTDFVIAVDDSESMRVTYDSSAPSKYIVGLILSYITAKIALKSRDRVFFLWNGEKFNVTSEQSLIDLLVKFENTKSKNDFWDTDFDSGTNIFIISDFFVGQEKLLHYIKKVSHISKNITSCVIQDLVEKDLDLTGRFKFLDPESESSILSETEKIKELYHKNYQQHFLNVTSNFKRFAIRHGIVLTDKDPFSQLVRVLS